MLQIALEALNQEFVDAAISDIRVKMNPLDYDPSPSHDAYEKIRRFANNTEDENLGDVINKSVDIVEECFTKYKPENVSVCFNGGKDCVAMLHIVHAVHQKLFPDKKLKSFYVSEKKTFREVDEFIEKAIEMYGLVTKTYEEPMKTALGRMLEDDPEVEATMLGVRVGDPVLGRRLSAGRGCLVRHEAQIGGARAAGGQSSVEVERHLLRGCKGV